MAEENWDELLGEAVENAAVKEAAKDMQEHVPDCARAINEAMAQYEFEFDKLVDHMAEYWTPSDRWAPGGAEGVPMPVLSTDPASIDYKVIDYGKLNGWYANAVPTGPGDLYLATTALEKQGSNNWIIPLSTMWTLAPFANSLGEAATHGPVVSGKSLSPKFEGLYVMPQKPWANKMPVLNAAYSKTRQKATEHVKNGAQSLEHGTPDPPVFSFREYSFGDHSAWAIGSADTAGLDPYNDAADHESWSQTPFLEEPFIKALEDGGASVEFLQLSYELLVQRNHGGWGAQGSAASNDTLMSLLLPSYEWTHAGVDLFGAGGSSVAVAPAGGSGPSTQVPLSGPAYEDLFLAGKQIETWKGDRSYVQYGAQAAASDVAAAKAYQEQAIESYTEAAKKCTACIASGLNPDCVKDAKDATSRYGLGTAAGAGLARFPSTARTGRSSQGTDIHYYSCGLEAELYEQAKLGLFGASSETGEIAKGALFQETLLPSDRGERFLWWLSCWQFGRTADDITTTGGTKLPNGINYNRFDRFDAQEEEFYRNMEDRIVQGSISETAVADPDEAEAALGAFVALAIPIMGAMESYLEKIKEKVKCIQKYTDAYEAALYNYLREAQEIDGTKDYLEFAANFWCKFFTGSGCTDQAKEKQEEFNERSQEKLAEHLDIEYGRRILYKEQCFLLSFITDFIDYKKNTLEPGSSAKRDKDDPVPPQAKRLPYYARFYGTDDKTKANACIQVEGDPYGFMNRLTQSPTQSELFKIEPHKLGHLQPMIRLFKINYNIGGNARREMQQEIPFEQSSKDIADALSDKNKRGAGVGIKKFLFVYDGSNPFAAKKSIKAKLVIFANSFDDLLKDRGGWRYVDLALKTAGGKLSIAQSSLKAGDKPCDRKSLYEENENLSKLNFRLKAVVGYARPSNDAFLTPQQKDAIYDSYVTLNLTPTVHDFAFDDMGRVTLTINYLAYIEDFFDQSLFNIFSEIETTKQRVDRNLRLKKWKSECDDDQINKIKESFADEVLEEKRTSVQSVISRLLQKNKVRYVNIPYAKITNFTKSGPFGKMSDYDVSTKIEDGVSNAEAWENLVKKAVKTYGAGGKKDVYAALTVTNPNNESLPFFYASDLVDVVLEQIDAVLKDMPGYIDQMTENTLECDREVEKDRYIKFEQQFKRFRCLLGPLEIVSPADVKKSVFASMGDIPISLKYFVGWLTNQLSKKNESVYPLAKFLNDFFNNLVKNFMNSDDCYGVNVKQKVRMQQAAITAYPHAYSKKRDTFTDMILSNWNNSKGAQSRVNLAWTFRQPILQVMGPLNSPITDRVTEEEFNYLVFFVGRTQPIDKMKGIRTLDEKVGIFHYMIGQPNGIVKKINLTKTDSKGLAEVRFEQDGYDGLKQLRVVYDVKVKTYANVQVFPGTYIFVEPLGFAPNMASYGGGVYDLSEYGIGGYCMVYRSTHVFAPGIAETELEAKWVNAIEKEAEEEERSGKNTNRQAGDNTDGYNKCTAEWRSEYTRSPFARVDVGAGPDAAFGDGLIRDTIELISDITE